MRQFKKNQRGFALVFAILLMPVFIGFAFVIIDVGRGNNAHADLSAAADALALAGARELDGGPDAIDRATSAMTQVTNSVGMLAPTGPDQLITLIYENAPGNAFQVAFLTDIPTYDTDPIDAAWLIANRTTDSASASYIYVRAQSRNLDSIFFNPASMLGASVPLGAVAVATMTSAVCDVPPLYICNPFEYDDSSPPQYVGDQLQTNFARGDLHGRMIRLHPAGNATHTPGNFGFLSVNDEDVNNGARAISDLFAGARNSTCYSADTVETKPGASNSIRSGLNTRFDIFMAPYQNGGANGPNSFTARSSQNVRKGIYPDRNGPNIQDCVAQGGGIDSGAKIGDDHVWDPTSGFDADGIYDFAYGLPDNNTMYPPNTDGTASMNSGIAGAYVGVGAWDVQSYLDRNYGANSVNSATIPNSFPGDANTYSGPGFVGQSRYDVYQWEQSNPSAYGFQDRAAGDPSVTNPAINGESGNALCAPGAVEPWDPNNAAGLPDPRVLIVAVVDCGTNSNQNGRAEFPVNSYASVFMTRPMISYGPSVDMTIDVEFIDITGFGGNGTLDDFVRDESVLVR